eukprot:456554_1
MAIMLYTDFTLLCTTFRTTFRKMEYDTCKEDIIQRHSSYYFFSRNLYEAIEFFGVPMETKKTVYHGLKKEFLFREFIACFHAPTSTSNDFTRAQIFSDSIGIILELRNGNENQTGNYIISKYSKHQTRYIDVSSFSDFRYEREWLFFGDTQIFKIHNITDASNIKRSFKKTVKQLELLQRIIENKRIIWKKESAKLINKLCIDLKQVRELNINKLEKLNDEVELKSTENEYMLSENDFIEFAETTLNEHKWSRNRSVDDKLAAIKVFKQYCQTFNITGTTFKNVNRKDMALWMQKKEIKRALSSNIHKILTMKIAEYVNNFVKLDDEIEKLKLSKIEYLHNFIEFAVKTLSNHKWKKDINKNQKLAAIDAFKLYCEEFDIDGNTFRDIKQKKLAMWMKKKKIQSKLPVNIYKILTTKIEEHEKNIDIEIGDLRRQLSQKFDVEYDIKLCHYFTASKSDFICIQSPFQVHKQLQNVLFIDNHESEEKYEPVKKRNTFSLTKLTDIFTNVKHIAFTELTYEEMVQNCRKLCMSVSEYVSSRNEKKQLKKQLKYIKLKSINMNHSKFSHIIETTIYNYQRRHGTKSIVINYKFQYRINHIITFEIINAKRLTIRQLQTIHISSNINDNHRTSPIQDNTTILPEYENENDNNINSGSDKDDLQ